MNIFFYTTAAIAIVAALAAITRREAMHGILYLIVVLVSLAIMFFQLGAPFVAALEIIVYAGAIVVLFLFVVMMINPRPESRGAITKPSTWFGPLVLVAILVTQLAFLLPQDSTAITAQSVGPRILGERYFSEYAYTLHLVALFLLVGIVGAFHLSRDKQTRDSELGTRDNTEPNT